MDCTKITEGLVAADCNTLLTGGTGSKVWMFNFADINKATSVNTDIVVSSIALKQDAKGYVFTSFDNSTEGVATLNAGTYVNTYDHQVTLRVFHDDVEERTFLANARGARVVFVVQKKTSQGYTNEVYGWDSGLKLNENPYNTKYTDNVVYAPVFKTDADNKESNLPHLCSMTEAALDALCQ